MIQLSLLKITQLKHWCRSRVQIKFKSWFIPCLPLYNCIAVLPVTSGSLGGYDVTRQYKHPSYVSKINKVSGGICTNKILAQEKLCYLLFSSLLDIYTFLPKGVVQVPIKAVSLRLPNRGYLTDATSLRLSHSGFPIEIDSQKLDSWSTILTRFTPIFEEPIKIPTFFLRKPLAKFSSLSVWAEHFRLCWAVTRFEWNLFKL